MLIEDIARYLASRQSLGFKIRVPASQLRRFGEWAAAHGDAVVRTATAISGRRSFIPRRNAGSD